MFKQILDEFISKPLLTSVLVIDFAILMVLRPPFFFSLIMLLLLVLVSIYFGGALAHKGITLEGLWEQRAKKAGDSGSA